MVPVSVGKRDEHKDRENLAMEYFRVRVEVCPGLNARTGESLELASISAQRLTIHARVYSRTCNGGCWADVDGEGHPLIGVFFQSLDPQIISGNVVQLEMRSIIHTEDFSIQVDDIDLFNWTVEYIRQREWQLVELIIPWGIVANSENAIEELCPFRIERPLLPEPHYLSDQLYPISKGGSGLTLVTL